MKIVNSFKYAFKGIGSAFKTERNMKIHVSIMLLVILMGLFFKITKLEWIVCLFCFSSVIGGELMNTAIEITVNLAQPSMNYAAGRAKDIAAGSVLLCAIVSAIIGLIIFIPYIINFFS